jgi:hypothetical protein
VLPLPLKRFLKDHKSNDWHDEPNNKSYIILKEIDRQLLLQEASYSYDGKVKITLKTQYEEEVIPKLSLNIGTKVIFTGNPNTKKSHLSR